MIETYREQLEEMIEWSNNLKEKIKAKENIEEKVKDMLLHSSISIHDCEKIFNVLNWEDRI